MPDIRSLAYPSAVRTMIALLEVLVSPKTNAPVPARTAPPPDMVPPLFVVKRIGGGPDADDITDHPVILVAAYETDYLATETLANLAQTAILSSPGTEVGGVLIDYAEIYVGEQEIPDVYPDDRRITSTYRLGWRRQFRPVTP